MSKCTFERKHKESKPVLAICYDFDKTLSPNDMQAQGYIQAVGRATDEFWQESNSLAEENDMDQNLAYMYKMVQEAEGNIIVNKRNLEDYGAKVKLFPGVSDWFERIRKYGEEKNVIIEHYVISSGLKEMIEGTEVAKKGAFEKIYASSFYFNRKGVAVWPAQVVNYTNKTQFLFRIEKGVLDINDPGVNEYFKPDELRIPFRNIVYIGDSDTDIPCMKLVNANGGHSVGVYNPESRDKQKVYKMMNDNRIKYFAEADYREGSGIDFLIKRIIDRTAYNERLEEMHFEFQKEVTEANNNDERNECQKNIDSLLLDLENSDSFKCTHSIIEKFENYNDWNEQQIEVLFNIIINNNQVSLIAADPDVKSLYENILEKSDKFDKKKNDVIKIMEDADK